MRNVNAEIGYIVNNIRWDKYDPKTISSVRPDLYDIVIDSAFHGVRRTLWKVLICDHIDHNLNRNDGK